MKRSSDMRQTLKDVFATQRFCVLATQGQGQPYGSLVAFAETADLKQLVFATSRGTRKFSNLISEPPQRTQALKHCKHHGVSM